MRWFEKDMLDADGYTLKLYIYTDLFGNFLKLSVIKYHSMAALLVKSDSVVVGGG